MVFFDGAALIICFVGLLFGCTRLHGHRLSVVGKTTAQGTVALEKHIRRDFHDGHICWLVFRRYPHYCFEFQYSLGEVSG